MSLPVPPDNINNSYIAWLTWKDDGKTVHGPGSNFFIEPDGTHVEGEFQAAKEANPFTRKKRTVEFLALSPNTAKRAGREEIELRADWEDVKIEVMKHWVFKKFHDHEILAEWLRQTGNKLIVEGNWWHDMFWGQCRCQKCGSKTGKNHLGKILMAVREEVR